MPRISNERREKRRRHILESAWTCFHRKGLQGTTMEDIIRQADASAGAVYLYFGGKEELVRAAVSLSLSELRQTLAPLVQKARDLSADELIGELLDGIVRFGSRKDYDLLRIALHGWSAAQHDEDLRALMSPFYLQFRNLLAQLLASQATGDGQAAEDQAQVLLSLLLGFVVQRGLLGDATPLVHARGLRRLSGRP